MQFNRMFNGRYSYWTTIVVLIVILVINFSTSYWNQENRVIRSDINRYYAHLPAVFIYQDITLKFYSDDPGSLGPQAYPTKLPNGNYVLMTTYGTALCYLPFFLIAHLLAPLLGYPADGFSVPYHFAIQMSSWFFLIIGLVFMRKLLKKYFKDWIVAVVIFATVIGTNMLWYVTGEAGMSHTYSFSLIAIFLYLMDTWLEQPTLWKTICLGLVIGLITLIRPTNALIGLVLIFWKVSNFKDLKNRFFWFLQRWYYVLPVLLFAFLVWVPQLLMWKTVTGNYFYYSYPDNQGFYFNDPELFNNLLSWRKGWLIYMPVMGFMLIGIGLLYKVKRDFFWPLLLYFLAVWYVLSSWWSWGFGGGLSIRAYIDSYAVFAVAMAGFLTWLFRQRKRYIKIVLMVVFVFTVWNGAFNNARYFYGSIHYDGMTKRTYLDGFFHLKPGPNYWDSVRRPDYDMLRKGINMYEDEVKENDTIQE